jgi:putative transposase
MRIGISSETMDGHQGTQAGFELRAHVVLVTKDRRGVLSHDAVQDLRAIFVRVCEAFKAELVRCSGQDDHVHLLVSDPSRISLSNLDSSLKSVSTRRLRGARPDVRGGHQRGVVWSPHSFAASSRKAALSLTSEYVRNHSEGAKTARPGR